MVLSVRGERKQGRWVYPVPDWQGERETGSGRRESGKQGRREKMRLESFKKPKNYLLFYKFYVYMENKYKIYLIKTF